MANVNRIDLDIELTAVATLLCPVLVPFYAAGLLFHSIPGVHYLSFFAVGDRWSGGRRKGGKRPDQKAKNEVLEIELVQLVEGAVKEGKKGSRKMK